MALVLKDRVRQTSTTAGYGTLTLSGSVTGYQNFSVIGTGNTTYYTITDAAGNWEVGLGTYTSPNQLSRDTVYESSNANALVNFTSASKDVFVTFPAEGFAAPPAIGGTTPNAITGTTITVWDAAITGTPGSFVIYDPITTGVTVTFTIDPASYNPTIFATDGTTNYPLRLDSGVIFPIGVNLDVGRTNSLILSNSGGAYTGLKAAAAGLSNYTLTLPTTAGSNNQVLKTDGSGNLSWVNLNAPSIYTTASSQNSTSTTLQNITGLTATLTANTSYRVDCFVTFQSAATTTGINFGFTSPTGTTCMLEVVVPITNTAAASQLRTIFPNNSSTNTGSVLGIGVSATNNNHTARFSGIIKVGGTGGTFAAQYATAIASSAITIPAGSTMVIQQIS